MPVKPWSVPAGSLLPLPLGMVGDGEGVGVGKVFVKVREPVKGCGVGCVKVLTSWSFLRATRGLERRNGAANWESSVVKTPGQGQRPTCKDSQLGGQVAGQAVRVSSVSGEAARWWVCA